MDVGGWQTHAQEPKVPVQVTAPMFRIGHRTAELFSELLSVFCPEAWPGAYFPSSLLSCSSTHCCLVIDHTIHSFHHDWSVDVVPCVHTLRLAITPDGTFIN